MGISGNASQSLRDERKDYEEQKENEEANRNTAEMLVEEIQEINEKIAKQAGLIEAANKEIEEIDAQIKTSEDEILEIEEDIREEESELAGALSLMYETQASQDQLSIFVRSQEALDLTNRDEYVRDMQRYINEKINTLKRMRDGMVTKEDALELLKSSKEEDVLEYQTQQAEMEAEIEQLTVLMEDAQQKADDAEAFANELEAQVLLLEQKERALLGGRTYNGDMSDVVYDGDGTDYYFTSAYPHSDYELTLLAGIIQAEAGSVSYPGMIAVGSVVMNRVESPNFDNTIEGVIYAPYQFEPAETGRLATILAQGPATSCYQAAQEVLDGKRNVPNLYFKAAWYAEAHGISGVNIGGNVFH